MESRTVHIADQMLGELAVTFPELDSMGLREIAFASCAANIKAGLHGFRRRALPETPPEEAILAARACARAGLPLGRFIQAYRLSHAVLSDALLAEITALDLTDDDKRDLLTLGSRFAFTFVDWMIDRLTEGYEEERRRHVGPAWDSRTAVQEALAGRRSSLVDIGYDETLSHRALICLAPVAEALAQTALELDLRLLSLAFETDVLWAWLGSSRTRDDAVERRALSRFCEDTGSAVTAGDCLDGLEGFVASHQQAQDALRVARGRGAGFTLYSDVALEVTLLKDERRARDFVRRELGGLAANDPKVTVLHETLRAYLECGQNAAAASARLGVHVHTVANRLRNIEERLGRPPAGRPAELLVALRVLQVLDG